MTDTPETDKCVKENRHIRFLEDDYWSLNGKATYTSAIVCLCRKLERERDEAVRSCHIWQTGHAESVARMYDIERKLKKITEALEYIIGIGLTEKTKAKAEKALQTTQDNE